MASTSTAFDLQSLRPLKQCDAQFWHDVRPWHDAESRSKHTQGGSAGNVMPYTHYAGWQDLPEQLLWSEQISADVI